MTPLQNLKCDLLLEVQVGNSGKHVKSCLGNAAVGHSAVAVGGFVMVQAFHQLIIILQMALSVFRAADQFGGGQLWCRSSGMTCFSIGSSFS